MRLAWSLLFVLACADERGPQLLAPETVSVRWNAAFNEPADGLIALVPIDVMVYDGATGAPLVAVPVTFRGLGLLELDAVLAADIDAADGEPLWDVRRDRAVSLISDPSWSVTVRTDAHGVARTLAWVDSFRESDGGAASPFQATEILVTAAGIDQTIQLTPR